jgi:hypothetical protein
MVSYSRQRSPVIAARYGDLIPSRDRKGAVLLEYVSVFLKMTD